MEKWGGRKQRRKENEGKVNEDRPQLLVTNCLIYLASFTRAVLINIGTGIQSPKMFYSVIINRDFN